MLCAAHHNAYDEHVLAIEALTEAKCDGRLRFEIGYVVDEE